MRFYFTTHYQKKFVSQPFLLDWLQNIFHLFLKHLRWWLVCFWLTNFLFNFALFYFWFLLFFFQYFFLSSFLSRFLSPFLFFLLQRSVLAKADSLTAQKSSNQNFFHDRPPISEWIVMLPKPEWKFLAKRLCKLSFEIKEYVWNCSKVAKDDEKSYRLFQDCKEYLNSDSRGLFFIFAFVFWFSPRKTVALQWRKIIGETSW